MCCGETCLSRFRKVLKLSCTAQPIGTLQFVIIDNIAGKRDTSRVFNISLTDVQIIDETMKDQIFNTADDAAVITQVTTNINELKTANKSLKIYPNPAKEILTIETKDLKVKHLKLVNLLGQVVIQKEVVNTDKITIQTGNLESGIYILSLITADGVISKTVVIEK